MKITYNASPKVALICQQAHPNRWSKFYSIASGIISRELALLIDDHKKKSRLLELSGIFDEIKVQHCQDHCMTKENGERRDRATRELCQIIRKTMPKDDADALTDYIYIIKDDLPYIIEDDLIEIFVPSNLSRKKVKAQKNERQGSRKTDRGSGFPA